VIFSTVSLTLLVLTSGRQGVNFCAVLSGLTSSSQPSIFRAGAVRLMGGLPHGSSASSAVTTLLFTSIALSSFALSSASP